MATTWTGTKEDRLRRIEQHGLRCDGAGRHCPHTAVRAWELMPVNPADGSDRPGASVVVQQACSKHRRAISERATYRVVSTRELPRRQVTDSERRAAAFRAQRMQPLVGCRFVAVAGEPSRLVVRVAFVVDDVQLTDEGGNTHMLRQVHQISLPDGYPDDGLSGDDRPSAQAARRRVPTPPRFRPTSSAPGAGSRSSPAP
jgi:hypothetical protein